ncbi:MAG: AbrB/MazE/SpoVT family DNA-binding domain-containing protein [Bryobacteraceae bacterium]
MSVWISEKAQQTQSKAGPQRSRRYDDRHHECTAYYDKAGRVVIPKPLREELKLEAGDALEMESTGECITLRPVRGTGPLTKEHGVWVFHTGQSLAASSTDDLLRRMREERDLDNLGTGE